MAPSFSRLKSWLSAPIGPRVPTTPIAIPVVSFGVRRGSREILRAYREDAWLRALVDTVADAVAKTRWRVYKPARLEGTGGLVARFKSMDPGLERSKAIRKAVESRELVELDDHLLLRLLKRPHGKHTGFALLKLIQQHLDLVGEAFIWLRRNVDGVPIGFEVVPPHCVHVTPSVAHPSFLVSYNLWQGEVPESEMLWLRHLDPENPEGRGTGRGLALGDEVDAREGIARTVKAIMQRGGVPAAVVGVENRGDGGDADTDDAVEDLETKYGASFGRPDQAGKVWFVPGGVTLAQVSVNFRELQLQELDKSLRDYARQTFNVPPELVGDLTSSNRSTSEEAKYVLAEYAVDPRLHFLAAELSHKLVPLLDPDAVLVYDDPRPQSWERRFKALTTPAHEGVYLNEYREFAGLEPVAELEGKRASAAPGAGMGGGASPEGAQANATPRRPPRPGAPE